MTSADTNFGEGLTSVVVVAADSGTGLDRCVSSVLACRSPLELIVSDNDTADGSVDRVRVRHAADPRLIIVNNEKNLGFGAGVNRAALQARGDLLLVLNPDCLIQPDLLVSLRAATTRNSRLGVLGMRITDPDGQPEPAARRRDPTLWRSLMEVSGLARWEQHWPRLAGVNLPAAKSATPGTSAVVDAVSGAAMAIPAEVFTQLGGFDEAYFLHCEDLDLCRRARDLGYEVCYEASLIVVHGKGGSSRHRPIFVSWHKHRGMWRWFRCHDPAARSVLLRGPVWIGLWLHFLLGVPSRAWSGWRARREIESASVSASG